LRRKETELDKNFLTKIKKTLEELDKNLKNVTDKQKINKIFKSLTSIEETVSGAVIAGSVAAAVSVAASTATVLTGGSVLLLAGGIASVALIVGKIIDAGV